MSHLQVDHFFLSKVGRFSPILQATQALQVCRGTALLFSRTFGTRLGGVSPTPRPSLPPGKTRYPFYSRLSGSHGRSERAYNLVPTGIGSRTVQPVAQSLYRLSYRAHTFMIIPRLNLLRMRNISDKIV